MKPKLFIGSSTEALNVAYAIQENLENDAEVTVWDQGVFKLSSSILNDLISTVNNSDFGIFVFNPDDISIIRNQSFSSTRDNVIFELGLFIGKLGQSNVFIVIPSNEEIHFPSDLIGLTPGKYNEKRKDGNLRAALGPFSNKVRAHLKHFKYTNLIELENESDTAKKIAVEKPYGYEHLLLAEFIESRLNKVNEMHENLKNGIYFVRSVVVSDKDYFKFFQETLTDFQRFATIFEKLLNVEVQLALGPNGIESETKDLIKFSEKLQNLSIELFNWETRSEQLNPPQELRQVKSLLKGSSETFLLQINSLPSELRKAVESDRQNEEYLISLKLEAPSNISKALELFQKHFDI